MFYITASIAICFKESHAQTFSYVEFNHSGFTVASSPFPSASKDESDDGSGSDDADEDEDDDAGSPSVDEIST